MFSFFKRTAYCLSSLLFISACSNDVPKETEQDQHILVQQATWSVHNLFNTPQNTRLLKAAKAIMLCPVVSNLSLMVGGAGGRCVLLNRDSRGSWSDPAFFNMTIGSFGPQIGYQNSQLVFFLTSQESIQALLDHQFTFDAAASAAFTKYSNGSQISHANNSSHGIYAVEKANGVFVGASLGGTKLTSDSVANRSYYQQAVGPEDIVVNMRVNNTDADPLRRALIDASR